MPPFSGKAGAVLAVSFVFSFLLTACVSPGAADDAAAPSGTPSATVSPQPRETDAPEPPSSGTPPSADGGKDADDDGGNTSGDADATEADSTVVEGRATTAVVPLDSGKVDVGKGLSVKLTAVERTTVEASMPGEIAGPAISVTVQVINSGAYHALGASVVNLYYGPDRIPASSLSGSGEQDLPASVAKGETVTGTYEFAVPDDRPGRVLVELDVDPQLHVALFEGEVSP